MDMEVLFTHSTEAVQGLYYLGPGDGPDADLEGIRLLLSNDIAIFLSSGTDWTLRLDQCPGSELPAWCYPQEDWGVRDLPAERSPHPLGRCLEAEEISNEVGEVSGLRFSYTSEGFTVFAGEPFEVRLHPARY